MSGVSGKVELVKRWRAIEDEEERNGEVDEPAALHRLYRLKERWFSDAFSYLMNLPEDSHLWCSSWELMGSLMETFYNYSKDKKDSPLSTLWGRLCRETSRCVQCVTQYHQAQEGYAKEYEQSSIGQLLEIVRNLDEQRVTEHLKNINARLNTGQYDPNRDNAEVVSLMYEVLMFPSLMGDRSLLTEFELFIELVDNMHELSLAGNQRFPGVYMLLFCNRRVRTVGRRLARSMDKLRKAEELEPLQHLLLKYIGFLEAEILPCTSTTTRPIAQPDRLSIWLGITSLFEFLEPLALEEGILERYPIFLDIVLNHVTGDSADFCHAVTCLRELFKMLGCKLWLRSTLSPSVMRNTLLGQCFHTKNEKIHKDIIDLFLPFLQSLEALQDGEHTKQRMHFLYFLLHQVPVSSNFNILTRKLACKVALLIVLRGYQMRPPCPPFECSHMWGPPLVSCLKDSFLHNSLREPAFDLIQSIIVSDATAIAEYTIDNCHRGVDKGLHVTFVGSECNDTPDEKCSSTSSEKMNNCWVGFVEQSENASHEFRNWMCIPMLWIEVLVDIEPSIFPLSFTKAVFWARSHLILLEPDNSAEMPLPLQSWMLKSTTELLTSMGWKVPSGYDDGGNGKENKNSVKVSMSHVSLTRLLKRLTTNYLHVIGQGELRKLWTWEPGMAKGLILSLLDSSDNFRQFGKCVLEQVSDTRGLAAGLNFLCGLGASLTFIYTGLRYALNLVQADCVISKFDTLQHMFFVIYKLLKKPEQHSPCHGSSEHQKENKYPLTGGFLTQPFTESFPSSIGGQPLSGYSNSFDIFCSAIAKSVWPPLKKLLMEGKAFINFSACQMACVRILEILPVTFDRLRPYASKSNDAIISTSHFLWIHDLIDWGKSSLKVVLIYWKRCVTSVLNILQECSNNRYQHNMKTIENLLSNDAIETEKLAEEVSRFLISFVKDVNCSEVMVSRDSSLTTSARPASSLKIDPRNGNSGLYSVQNHKNKMIDPVNEIAENLKLATKIDRDSSKTLSISDVPMNVVLPPHSTRRSEDDNQNGDSFLTYDHKSEKTNSDKLFDKSTSQLRNKITELGQKLGEEKRPIEACGSNTAKVKSLQAGPNDDQACETINRDKDSVSKDVPDIDAGLFDSKIRTTTQSHVSRLKVSIPAPAPKRQVIQLKMPSENRHGISRLDSDYKRFKPAKLDDWYKPILEVDYFAVVGLTPKSKAEKLKDSKLKEVPISFESPEKYISILRPYVLEEFKAQLHASFMEMSSWDDVYYGCISVLSAERIDDFHLLRFVHDDNDVSSNKSFVENDLVLLSKSHPRTPSQDVHAVGKVERRERDSKRNSSILLVRFYFLNGSERLYHARRQLVDCSKWHASRIMNITSQLREFQALSSLKSIPVHSAILNPVYCSAADNGSKVSYFQKISRPLQKKLSSSFNESQIKAIEDAVKIPSSKSCDLSLIQGPPGTGKTRTIVAIVSSIIDILRGSSNSSKLASKDSSSGSTSKFKNSESVALARAWQDAALAKQLHNDTVVTEQSSAVSSRGRVLLCAQSNAAVDELVWRISSDGLYGSDGKTYMPYMVRVGNVKTVHTNSLPFFLDTLVDQRLSQEKTQVDVKSNISTSSADLRSDLEKLSERIRFYEAKRANLMDCNSESTKAGDDAMRKDACEEMPDAKIEGHLRTLYAKKKEIYRDLNSAQARERKSGEEVKGLRHKLRKSILREAEIVITTLSGCGGDVYNVCSESMSSNKMGSYSEQALFDAIVIDEAAQALEPATLIPLQLLKSNAAKCVMVGDPKQLPATVLSNTANMFFYQCSMFERLQKAGHPVLMLTKQYRMHPEICRFPSLHFYDGKLLTGEISSDKTASFHENRSLGPYLFYDIADGMERRDEISGALSLYNEHEADAAVELLRFFKKRYPTEFVAGRIGVLTPYKRQLSLLRSRFASAFGSSVAAEMELNTVDGFQGREIDILILSTVRSSQQEKSASIGFVADVRRMNVALTRAKLSLWILGDAATLRRNRDWAALLTDAAGRNLIVSIRKPYKSSFRTQNEGRAAANDDAALLSKKSGKRKERKPKEASSDDAEIGRRESVGDIAERTGALSIKSGEDPARSPGGGPREKKATSKRDDGKREAGMEICRYSEKKGRDDCSSRKKQRDAANAFLSASLISSNKPKRPRSPTPSAKTTKRKLPLSSSSPSL